MMIFPVAGHSAHGCIQLRCRESCSVVASGNICNGSMNGVSISTMRDIWMSPSCMENCAEGCMGIGMGSSQKHGLIVYKDGACTDNAAPQLFAATTFTEVQETHVCPWQSLR